ncbi:MAG: hypothetical protein ACK56F_04260, partial [bacterium]
IIKSIIFRLICLIILTLLVIGLWLTCLLVVVNLVISLLGIALLWVLLIVLAISLLAVIFIIDWHNVIIFHVAQVGEIVSGNMVFPEK